MLLLTAAENRKILQSMAESKRGLSAGLRPESGGGLFTAVAFLRRINFVQIAARFRRRMAGGQRLVDVPGAMLLIILAACTLSLEKTRSTLPAPPL